MPAVVRRRPPQSKSYVSGPWKGVRSTKDPFDGDPDVLLDATNIYFPDAGSGAGVYGWPGFSLLNSGNAITTSATTFRGQGAFSFTSLNGVSSNFVIFNGKLFRGDSAFGVFTDVSPAGITIDPSVTTRVYGTTFITQLIVTDGVNRPWLLTNPTASPVTGTYIDYDGSGTTWAAFGPFVSYGGSAFCILQQVNNVVRRSDISWSNPADASTGWQQVNYDFNWTLEQSTSEGSPPPLTALAGDNDGLTYWRESSIGSISGTPGPNLQSSASHDAISKNIGTLSPQSVKQFGRVKFFADALGRTYRLAPAANALTPSGGPEPLWKAQRSIVDASSVAFPAVNKTISTAAFEPTFNKYIIAPWSPIPSQSAPAIEGYNFDGETGNYEGRFVIGPGIQLETLAVFVDANGRGMLVALGSLVAPTSSSLATSGYLWGLNALVATGDFITTEVAAPNLVYLTDESTPAVMIVSEGSVVSGWTDNGQVKNIDILTPLLGYDIDTVIAVDRVSALVTSGASVSVSAETSGVTETLEGTATASTKQDGTGRVVVGFSGIQGRGVAIEISPTTSTAQFALQQISVQGVVSNANPDEG
jgi:hypothetical protein